MDSMYDFSIVDNNKVYYSCEHFTCVINSRNVTWLKLNKTMC